MIPTGAARLLGRMPALLLLLLLAAAASAPALAQPSGWTQGDQHNEEALDGFTVAGLNGATSDTDTGLRFQQMADNCGSVRLRLGGGSQDRFAYYYYNGDTRSGGPYRLADYRAPLRDDWHFRLYFRDQYSSFVDGIARITMAIDSFGCSGGTPGTRNLVWEVNVVDAWGPQASHKESVNTGFNPISPVYIRQATSRQDTGLAFHQASSCNQVNVALVNSPDPAWELRRYNSSGTDTNNTNFNNIRMQSGDSNDNHVRLFLKAGATLTAGSTMTVSVSGNRACAGGGRGITIAYKMTVGTPATWPAGGRTYHSDEANFLAAADLNAANADTPTGLVFQRFPSDCAAYDVQLDSSVITVFGLASYEGNTKSNNVLENNLGGNATTNVRIYLRASNTFAEVTLAVPMVARGLRCAIGRQPERLTVTWQVTVQGPTAWRPRANDRRRASDRFSRYNLLDSTTPTATGIQIHRSADDCPNSVDVTLSTDTPDYVGLDLHGDGSGVALARSHSGVAMPGTGTNDRHLRLFFAAGADVPAGIVEVTATLSSACARGPQEAVYQLTVYTPADHTWVTLSQDNQTLRATSFRQSAIRDGQLATGIRLHRNSEECKRTDVELTGGTDYLELVAHNAAGAADGTGAAELEEVLMDPTAGNADRHVRLQFKAGALPPGAITATLRVAAAASCTSRRNPDEETLTYVVPIVVDVDTPPQLSVNPTAVTINADAETTGIRIGATDDDDSDVVVALASAARSRFTLMRLGAGSYELRVNAAGTLRHGARYTVGFTASDDVGTQTQSQGRVTIEIIDGAPVLSLSSTAVTIAPNRGASAPTGLTIMASDDDAANLRIVLDAAAQVNFEVRNIGGDFEVYARAGVSLAKGARYTLTITAIDDVGPGADLSATARALVMIRSGSAVASDDAAIDAGAAAARAIGVGGIDAVLSRSATDARLYPDAGTALLEMLAAKEAELESGEIDLREFLEGQTFAMGLNQNPAGSGGNIGIWLTGGRRDVGGVAGDDGVYVDGELSSMNFGLDGRFGSVLAGLAYGLHTTTAEYGFDEERENETASEYELELQALQPYAAFDVGAGRLAVAIAAGSGELQLRPEGEEEPDPQDVAYLGYAFGVAQRFAVFGGGQVRLRGSYASGELDVDQLDDLAATNLDSSGSVLRVALGYGHVFELGEAASFGPFLETGYLNMWGDGAVGDSLLAAGGLEFNGGPVSGSASYQQALSEDVSYEGYDLSFRLGVRFSGLGLGLEADPGYGLSGADGLLADLDAGRPLALADEDRRGLRGGAGVSYGLAVDGGLLTPYGRWNVDTGKELGLRLQAGERRSWALGYGAADNDFKLEYRLGE